VDHHALFFRLAKAGFAQKRKKMRNALSAGMSIPAERAENLLVMAGIDPASRAQMLDFKEWGRLTQTWLENQ
jgi:16S rRNA (adenine1518-N6/adenine1519-N6)-dimethyltransferase